MADMSWEHASEARAALNAIVTDPEHGVAALSNAQTMSNLLKDYLPDAPREKSILVAAAEAGLADTLRDHVAQGMDPDTAIRLTASFFSSSTPFTPEACSWVTDELAVALGISQPRQPGSGQAEGGAAGSASMPTRIVPIPGGPQLGGFGQQQGQGYPAQQPQPQPQPQPYQQPQPYPGQQGRGYQGQPGFQQVGQPGRPGAWPPAPYQPGNQLKPKGRRRGLLVIGGLLLVVVAAGVIGVVLNAQTTNPQAESLRKIMNPANLTPVATDCIQAPLLGLKASTLTSRLLCSNATTSNIDVLAYQFDNNSDYQAGFAQINSFTGFQKTSSTCPPARGSTAGSTGWHADRNPKYVSRPGQVIECFIDNKQPVLIWTMPTMNVVFIARDSGTGDTISRVLNWWDTVDYG